MFGFLGIPSTPRIPGNTGFLGRFPVFGIRRTTQIDEALELPGILRFPDLSNLFDFLGFLEFLELLECVGFVEFPEL